MWPSPSLLYCNAITLPGALSKRIGFLSSSLAGRKTLALSSRSTQRLLWVASQDHRSYPSPHYPAPQDSSFSASSSTDAKSNGRPVSTSFGRTRPRRRNRRWTLSSTATDASCSTCCCRLAVARGSELCG